MRDILRVIGACLTLAVVMAAGVMAFTHAPRGVKAATPPALVCDAGETANADLTACVPLSEPTSNR